MSGRRGKGVGDFRGFYATSVDTRRSRKKYTDNNDNIHINVPLGTRERIKKTGYKQQRLFRKLIYSWLNEKRNKCKSEENEVH